MADQAPITSLAGGAPAAPRQQQEGSIAQQILNAPEEVWGRISAALQVDSREQAVQLVEADQQAAAKVMAILGAAAQDTVATTPAPEASPTLATGGPVTKPPAADRIYPQGGGVKF